tara:strand:- start:380 stop:538 length:159 start_codon:yes stop_codon:yes gene_type:complete
METKELYPKFEDLKSMNNERLITKKEKRTLSFFLNSLCYLTTYSIKEIIDYV